MWAATDAILESGAVSRMWQKIFTFDTSKMEAFLVPSEPGVEVFRNFLCIMLSCGVDGQGFQVCHRVTLKGTN